MRTVIPDSEGGRVGEVKSRMSTEQVVRRRARVRCTGMLVSCVQTVYITHRPRQEISLRGRVIYKARSEVESIKVSFLCC